MLEFFRYYLLFSVNSRNENTVKNIFSQLVEMSSASASISDQSLL
jgi:hypothetical protein